MSCKWGIIGPGRIAGPKFAEAWKMWRARNCMLLLSRDAGRAKAFAEKYKAQKSYADYGEIAVDPKCRCCLYCNSRTLITTDKLVMSSKQEGSSLRKSLCRWIYKSTLEMVNAARESGVFLMEAMWTRFLPSIEKALQLIADGRNWWGKIYTCRFWGYFPFRSEEQDFWSCAGRRGLAGYWSIYNVHCLVHLGEPEAVKFNISHFSVNRCRWNNQCHIVLSQWKYGQCSCNRSCRKHPLIANITRTLGTITIHAPFISQPAFSMTKNGEYEGGGKRFDLPYGTNGLSLRSGR